MNIKRILLFLLAAVFLWWVFVKRKALPQTVVVGYPANPNQALSTATSQSIYTAAQAAQPGIAAISGTLVNGIANSLNQWGQGGSNGADTGSSDAWGTFVDSGYSYSNQY